MQTTKNNLKIAIIGSAGVPARYGGFESLIENLLEYTPSTITYTVFCSSIIYKDKISIYKGANLEYIKLKPNGLSSIIYDGISLLKCTSKRFDLILILGTSGAIFFPIIKPLIKSKIICNLDGIEWKRNKWSVLPKLFLKLSERLAVRYSDTIISDNQGISEHVYNTYNRRSEIIAYGSDSDSQTYTDSFIEKYNLKSKDYYFKVCRIEPENNIELILDSFSEIKDQRIVIVGNWNNSSFGKKMRNKYKEFSNITLIDPIYNLTDLNQLRVNCKGYIHGHSAGGTNPSLVEAMGLKLPIIAFDVNFNRYTLDNNGFYFSDKNDLIYEIDRFNSRDIETVKERIFETFLNRYTKEKIAEEYRQLFIRSC